MLTDPDGPNGDGVKHGTYFPATEAVGQVRSQVIVADHECSDLAAILSQWLDDGFETRGTRVELAESLLARIAHRK